MSHRVTLEDGSHLILPTPRLSFTQVAMYLKCPRQYHFRYVEGRKEPPGIALIEGSCHHEAIETANIHQIKTGDPMPTNLVQEKFSDEFATRQREVEDWADNTAPDGKATPDLIHERGQRIARTFAESIAPDYTPVSAERELTISARGIPLVCYTDMETAASVFDYKVSKSNSPYFRAGSAESSLQLSIYAQATAKTKVGFIGLLKNKPDDYKTVTATRTPGDWAYAEEVIVGVAKAISAGAFPMCGPEQFLCAEKWCGYWHRCRGALLGATPADKVSVVVPEIKIDKPKRKSPPKRKAARRRK